MFQDKDIARQRIGETVISTMFDMADVRCGFKYESQVSSLRGDRLSALEGRARGVGVGACGQGCYGRLCPQQSTRNAVEQGK